MLPPSLRPLPLGPGPAPLRRPTASHTSAWGLAALGGLWAAAGWLLGLWLAARGPTAYRTPVHALALAGAAGVPCAPLPKA